VLATESTARSERLAHLIREHANDVHVHVEACAGWATRIETLELDRADFADEVRARVEPLLARDIDRLVLGCTHYSFIAPLLSPITRGRAELVDVAEAVARQTVRVTLPGQRGDSAKLLLQASAHPERLHVALHRLGLSWLADRAAPAVLMHVD
jgi:glutamate racemase